MNEKYIMITWPEIQLFMEHKKWSKCICCQEVKGHPCPSPAYMVPESLYDEVYGVL